MALYNGTAIAHAPLRTLTHTHTHTHIQPLCTLLPPGTRQLQCWKMAAEERGIGVWGGLEEGKLAVCLLLVGKV